MGLAGNVQSKQHLSGGRCERGASNTEKRAKKQTHKHEARGLEKQAHMLTLCPGGRGQNIIYFGSDTEL